VKNFWQTLKKQAAALLSSSRRKNRTAIAKDILGKEVMAQQLIAAFGGEENILSLAACITRLRIEVKDLDRADQKKLKALGAAGVIIVEKNMQAIFGPRSETLMHQMRDALAQTGQTETPAQSQHSPQENQKSSHEVLPSLSQQWIAALGTADNIIKLEHCALTRLRVQVKDPTLIDREKLREEGVQAIVQINDTLFHLLIGLDTDQ
jgi:PTS system glucose-specific IIC component